MSLDFGRAENSDRNDYLKPPETSNGIQMERSLPPNVVFPLMKHRRVSYSEFFPLRFKINLIILDSIDTLSQRTDSTVRTKNALKVDNHPNRKPSAIEHSWALPAKRPSQTFGIKALLPKPQIVNGIVIPGITLDLIDDQQQNAHSTHEGPYLESGKFFVDPDNVEDDEESDSTADAHSIASTTMTVKTDRKMSIADVLRSRAQSTALPMTGEDNFCGELKLLLKYLNPIDLDEFKEGSRLSKVLMIFKVGRF